MVAKLFLIMYRSAVELWLRKDVIRVHLQRYWLHVDIPYLLIAEDQAFIAVDQLLDSVSFICWNSFLHCANRLYVNVQLVSYLLGNSFHFLWFRIPTLRIEGNETQFLSVRISK